MVTTGMDVGELFRDEVQKTSQLLLYESLRERADALAVLALAVCRADGPSEASDFVTRQSENLGLSPEGTFAARQRLAELGVQGALNLAREADSIVKPLKEESGSTTKIADPEVGRRLLELIAAGDETIFGLAEEHIRASDNPKMAIRRIELLYRAGHEGVMDLVADTVSAARARASLTRETEPFDNRRIDTSLYGIGSHMIRTGQAARLGEIGELIQDPSYLFRLFSELHLHRMELRLDHGEQVTDEAAEIVMKACRAEDSSALSANYYEALNNLLIAGYGPAAEFCVERFADPVEGIDKTSDDVLQAMIKPLLTLAKVGDVTAASRLEELSRSKKAHTVLEALSELGGHEYEEYVHNEASRLHETSPSPTLLRLMLRAKFTPERWMELQKRSSTGLPPGAPGNTVLIRAGDLSLLAEHVRRSKAQPEAVLDKAL